MKIIEMVITCIFLFLVAGGSLFALRKSKNKKTNIKNITINGNGKVIAGDDNSTHIHDNTVTPS